MRTNKSTLTGAQGGVIVSSRSTIIAFPRCRRHPPTISEITSAYKSKVKACIACDGPVHPVDRQSNACLDCEEWGLCEH